MKRLLLEVKGGGTAPAELPRSGMLAIGSDAERAGFVLGGQGVDDVHCAIGRTKDGTFAIKDLGSEYGTFLNGEKIAQARLSVGDEILLGSVRLVVVDGSDAPQPAAAATPAADAKPKPAAKRKSKSAAPEIPGYEVAHRLGHGAMGDVYLAVQKSLDREVALKVLSKKHEQDQAFVRSFQAEARSAAALNHPNIVTVHDVGEHEGVHYLTMEYMDRASLEVRVVKEGALPWPIVLEALKDAASGLVYAESRGLVHRDIKPANLMQNHTGTTKIADLGLATSISEEDAGDDGQKILGTPHFISPEQIRGEKADCRSDLYSLGSTAYRLLTGQTPFQGTNTREILRSKLRDEPKPVRLLANDVPEGLVEIVDRLMKRDPADRYPSASALLREIERLQSGATAAAAAQAGTSGGLGKKLALPVGGALALLVGGLVIFGGGDDQPQREDRRPNGGTGLVEGGGKGADSPPLGDVTEADPMLPAPVDDDVAEKLFETNAENALLRLNQRDLGPAARRDELRTLAKEFLGTTAANQAIEEADRLEQEIRDATAQRTERDSAVASILKALNDAANLDAKELNPGSSLRAMAAVPGIEAFAADDGFQAELRGLQGRVLAAALVQFSAAEAAMLELQGSGDFDGLRAQLLRMLGRTKLPAFEEGAAPTGATEVVDYGVRWRARLDSLDTLAATFEVEQQRADKRSIGTELGAASGLAQELARLDFAAAAARTARLGATLGSGEARAWNAALGAKLQEANGSLPILWNHWSSWRRTRVSDPRERRGAPRDAVSASATGVVLEEDGGGTEEIPWSAFGAHTKALDLLFSKRLDRDYTAEEAGAIAALMHFSAIAECLQLAAEMFQPNSGAVFTESEAEALPEGFDVALEWATTPEDRAALRRDREASELLGRALFRASESEWTTAVAGLERLLAEYAETWLVRLLSDGSTVTLPE